MGHMCSESPPGGNQVDGLPPATSRFEGFARNLFPESEDVWIPEISDDKFANGLRQAPDMCLKFVIDQAACLILDFWCGKTAIRNFSWNLIFVKNFENPNF